MTELVFTLDDDFCGAVTEPSTQDGLIRSHLSFLLRPITTYAARLLRDVEFCILRHSLVVGAETCSAQQLVPALAGRGHFVTLVQSAGGGSGTAAFRNLRHTFIAVSPSSAAGGSGAPASCCKDACRPELVVDPHFGCQFVVANPSPRFAALQRLLPQAFVGTMEQLEHVVDWVCREMEWSFKQQGQALPPWREHGAMLTKWQPRADAPQQQCSSPRAAGNGSAAAGSPPAACCCQDGGVGKQGMGAPGGGRCCEQRSPSSVLPGTAPTPFMGGYYRTDLRQSAAPLSCNSASALADQRRQQAQPSAAPGQRRSLLSRSLEAAGLRRAARTPPAPLPLHYSPWAGGGATSNGGIVPPASSWWEPRTHVVRRSA